MSTVSKSEQAEAIERLRQWIKPGDTIYCILRSVSRSGMSRKISFLGITPDRENRPEVSAYSYNVAKALGYRCGGDRDALTVNGCGMDMGFAVVYDLSLTLFNDPKALTHRWL